MTTMNYDVKATQKRIKDLQEYYDKYVFSGRTINCKYHPSCIESIKEKPLGFGQVASENEK